MPKRADSGEAGSNRVDEQHGGGGDRLSLATGWLKNGLKGGGIAAKYVDVTGGDHSHGGGYG